MQANQIHIATPFQARVAVDPPGEINMSQIRVSGGAIGFVFAGGTAYIFLVGIPAVRWFFIGAVLTGTAISVALALFHRCRPARLFTLLC